MNIKTSSRSITTLAAVMVAIIGAGLYLSLPSDLYADSKDASETSVGFVYVGPIGDHGWTYRHDIGRKAVERELGVKTALR